MIEMKESSQWGSLGFVLTIFSLATYVFCPESPISIGFMTLPIALSILLYSGTIMLSVGSVAAAVDRLFKV
jgi:hypothetical protein